MTEPSFKKQGFKKCRSATFSIDGFSFTIGKTRANGLSVGVFECKIAYHFNLFATRSLLTNYWSLWLEGKMFLNKQLN